MNAEPIIESALPRPAAGRRTWVVVLLALAIFVAGLASGAGLTVLVAVRRVQHAIQHPEDGPPRLAARLQRRLGLNEKQTAEVEAILKKRQTELAAIRRRIWPDVQREIEQVRADVAAVLTDEQRAHWATLYEEFHRRWLPPPADEEL